MNLTEVESWLGKSHEEMNCWQLVQAAHKLDGVSLPNDYYRSLSRFRPVTEPKPGDVIAIRNHPFVTNHCALYLGDGRFIHSLEGVGVCIGFLNRDPWAKPGRIAGFLRLRSNT